MTHIKYTKPQNYDLFMNLTELATVQKAFERDNFRIIIFNNAELL